jgi:hypothetical protein
MYGLSRRGAPVLLIEEREKQMLRLDVRIVVPYGDALGVGERLLEFGGEFVETHGPVPLMDFPISPA